jgi:hypothetical protein
MSILKKLIATAGVFALASASLVSAPVSAATLNLQNATIPSGFVLCVISDGGLITSGTQVSSSISLTQSTNGTKYTIAYVNSSSCSLATSSNSTIAPAAFYAFTNHDTQLSLNIPSTGTTGFTAAATYANRSPKYDGANTINVCLGDSRTYQVVINDADNDVLKESAAATLSGTNSGFITSQNNSAGGSYTYTIQPNTQAYSTLNNTFTFTPTVVEDPAGFLTSAIVGNGFGTTTPAFTAITFKTVDCGGVFPTTSSSSKSSSSVSSMSSSSVSSTVATPVASTVAASSKAPTEVAAAPMADSAKGSTVRTGGVN